MDPSSPTKTGSTTWGKKFDVPSKVFHDQFGLLFSACRRPHRKESHRVDIKRSKKSLCFGLSPEKNIRRRFPSSISSLQTDLLRVGCIQIARPLCAPVNERRGCLKEKAQLSVVRASLSLRAAVCLGPPRTKTYFFPHRIRNSAPLSLQFSSPPPPPSFSPECPCSAYRGSTRGY